MYQKWIIHGNLVKGSNVRRGRVGTFFDICSILGRLLPYNFKILYCHLPRNDHPKNYVFLVNSHIVWNVLRSFLNECEISVLLGMLEYDFFLYKLAFVLSKNTVLYTYSVFKPTAERLIRANRLRRRLVSAADYMYPSSRSYSRSSRQQQLWWPK
jgi:hypothetical protein